MLRWCAEWAKELGYEPVVFNAVDPTGVPIYHTNVLMCIGETAAIVGAEAIVAADRGRVLERLRATGREIIEIGHQEIEHFAGNMLELGTWDEALGDYRGARHVGDGKARAVPASFRTIVGLHG